MLCLESAHELNESIYTYRICHAFVQSYFFYLYIILRCLEISEVDKAVILFSFVLCVYDIVYQIFHTMSICSLTVVKV